MKKQAEVILILNVKNLNDHMYTTSDIQNMLVQLNEKAPIYGSFLLDTTVVTKKKSTHFAENFNIKKNDNTGNYELIADVTITDESLKNAVEQYVFRPNSIGNIVGDVVEVEDIVSIAAVDKMKDSYKYFFLEEPPVF